jgi:plasmid maintenance system killer protein
VLSKIFLITITLLFSLSVFSTECLLTKAMSNPKLKDNKEFWKDYSSLMASGKSSDDALTALAGKYDFSSSRAPTVASSISTPKPALRLDVHKRAKGEITRLPAPLKKKVDGFLEVILKPGGIKEVRDNPGKWHFEKLAQFGPEAHSVRLNGGYRIMFDLKGDDLILREVNKGHIHGN